MSIRLSEHQRQRVRELMNPEGSNYKDCNFFRIVSAEADRVTVEVGYWITYLNCRPKYEKHTRTFSLSELNQ